MAALFKVMTQVAKVVNFAIEADFRHDFELVALSN